MNWWGWIAIISTFASYLASSKEMKSDHLELPNPWFMLLMWMIWWSAWQ